MKKRSLFLATFLLLAMILPSGSVIAKPLQEASAVNDHGCGYVYSSSYWRMDSWTDVHHISVYVDLYKCQTSTCRNILELVNRDAGWLYNTHNMTTRSLGHSGNKHTYQNGCSGCGYTQTSFTITCSGPPCVYPYSLALGISESEWIYTNAYKADACQEISINDVVTADMYAYAESSWIWFVFNEQSEKWVSFAAPFESSCGTEVPYPLGSEELVVFIEEQRNLLSA